MRRRQAIMSLVVSAVVLLALLGVFGIELSDTQAKSKRDVIARVHERAVLAAALIDSLFNTVDQQLPLDRSRFGGPVVTARAIRAALQTSLYLAVLDADGKVIAKSSGFTSQARTELAGSAAMAMVRAGRPYGLGDVLPYGGSRAIDLAVRFPAADGSQRVLVTGFSPTALAAFLGGELKRIPGVTGAHSYLIDGRGTVIGSTNAKYPTGYVFDQPAQRRALAQSSGDVAGHYYVQVPIPNSTWRILLSAPDAPLFASVSGARKWVPWVIFAAFGIAALLALAFGLRTLRAAAEAHEANRQLGEVNERLAETNAALERRAAELARSNNELEQFASIASHDLQEPLRKVRTFTQQVVDRDAANLSERGQDYLARTSSAAERMQRLIEDLLRFSRVSTQGRPFAPVDLAALTDEVLVDLETQVADAGAAVEVSPLPTVNGDRGQLRQLIQNLLSNALKFRRDDIRPEVAISATVEGDRLQLSVRDNGIGFDPRYERRIFRVFERLHSRNEYPGTGIGLALCRKIAERHGGTVTASSAPGAGATFTVTLPLHQCEEVLPAMVPDEIDPPPGTREEPYVTA